jgi:O-antigen/teichoic acid export membrane protein
MKIYAYISIIESLLKLVAIFLLIWTEYDNLIMYSGLIFILSLTMFVFYFIYCNSNFYSAKYTFCRDYKLFYKLLNYAGWNFFGSLSSVTAGQGINILLNLFFGPTINAARAISFQVSGAVQLFVTNFQIAINPQIIKSFASNDIKYMHQIVFQGSKYSFFLLYIFALPLLLETEIILKTWLNIVPNYTIIFTRLVLVNILIDSVSGTLITSAQASGKIKKYQTVVGLLLLLTLPMSYLFLYLGFSPQITIYISILISILCLCARLLILKPLIGLPINRFINEVILKIISVVTVSSIITVLISSTMAGGLTRFLIIIITSIFITLISIYLLGMNNQEKLLIKSQINKLKTKS